MDYKTIKENFEKAVDEGLNEVDKVPGKRHPANVLASKIAKNIEIPPVDQIFPSGLRAVHFALKSYNVDPGKLEAAIREELNGAIIRAMMKSPYQQRGAAGPSQGPFKVSKGWFEMSREEQEAFMDDPRRGGEGF